MEASSLSVDGLAAAKATLRAADPRMAELVDADPTLDPEAVLDGWPTDLWNALVFQVVAQQLSVAATRAILARLEALHDGRLPTPAELLATKSETLRGIGLSRAKAVYLHDLAERLSDGRLDLERLRNLDDEAARLELMQVKGVGRFTADGVLMLPFAGRTSGPPLILRYGGQSNASGDSTRLRRSPTSTRSARAFRPCG